MIILELIKIALQSVWRNKGRSFLTMLGIIIGIFSVVIFIAIGQGAKNEIVGQIKNLGSNLLIVVPGKIEAGKQVNPSNFVGGNILTEKDVATIKIQGHVEAVTPMMIVSSSIKNGDKTSALAMTVGVSNEFVKVVNLKIAQGDVFQQNSGNFAVLGQTVAEDLFGGADAVGKKFELNSQEFTIAGVFAKQDVSALSGDSYNTMVAIPFETAKEIVGSTQINRILVKIDASENINSVQSALKEKIKINHVGNEDFSVLNQSDLLSFLDTILNLLTAFITSIAAISLIVGGIGIMNIMLVTVTERTREIGLRKSVGATNFQILLQFLIEAVILSLMGGLLALALAFTTTLLIAKFSPITPAITWWAVGLALGVCLGVGVVFGLTPAVRASRKNPIEALRYE